MRKIVGSVILCLIVAAATHAATPCDFKGLSIGDTATPQQIMAHFGITKFMKNADDPSPNQIKEQHQAAFNAQLKRAQQVSLTNAAEKKDWNEGSACGRTFCRIKYGDAQVGEEPYSIPVGVYAFFNTNGKITAIDIIYCLINNATVSSKKGEARIG